MNATVTIALKDFDKLRTAESEAKSTQDNILRAAKELEVFLSFLCTRENLSEYVEEFNRQSQTSRINMMDGRAKIVFKDAEN
jgi:hypothetical protein